MSINYNGRCDACNDYDCSHVRAYQHKALSVVEDIIYWRKENNILSLEDLEKCFQYKLLELAKEIFNQIGFDKDYYE